MYTNAFSRGCSLIPFQPPVSPSLGGVGSWVTPPNPRHPPMADAPLYSLVNKRLLLTRLSISLFSPTCITQSNPGVIASPSPEGRSNLTVPLRTNEYAEIASSSARGGFLAMTKESFWGDTPLPLAEESFFRKDPLHFPVAERPRKLRTSHSQCDVIVLL